MINLFSEIKREVIDELKKSVFTSSSTMDGVDIIDIYRKADRSYYETALLFKFCYHFIRRFNKEEFKAILEQCHEVGVSNGLFDFASSYPNSCLKVRLEMLMGEVIVQNSTLITDVIDFVFVDVIGFEHEKSDKQSTIIAKINEIRNKR